MGNSFGQVFRVSTFGESHGTAIGVVIDGCPAGLRISVEDIATDLARRRPGQSKITTQRKEADAPEILSGIYEGITTGMPICILIRNENVRSQDYSHLKDTFRPSHADFTYQQKYGHRDHRGGGRSSARETANWVAAGAVAKALLLTAGVSITAFVSQVGEIFLPMEGTDMNLGSIEENLVRCPDAKVAGEMLALIETVRKQGDTVGGRITCICKNVPVGLGSPVFHKLHADLGHAMLSINAAKGFEIGEGFGAAAMRGSQHNDAFVNRDSEIGTATNRSGGIQGGISNGEDIFFNIAFKPVATLMRDQTSVDSDGNEVLLKGKGRHDPCVVPRAVPIVEAMAALVLADHLLLNRLSKI